MQDLLSFEYLHDAGGHLSSGGAGLACGRLILSVSGESGHVRAEDFQPGEHWSGWNPKGGAF